MNDRHALAVGETAEGQSILLNQLEWKPKTGLLPTKHTRKTLPFMHQAVAMRVEEVRKLADQLGLREVHINNRRYLGNKYALSDFIRRTVEVHCRGVSVVADVFSGTGAVANVFRDKQLITNDLLYSNYLAHIAWFLPEEYSCTKILCTIYDYNQVQTDEENYMRKNFANTFFSATDCSKIGWIREDIEKQYRKGGLNFKEYAILVTALLYGMDRIANTVGHYDAYRRNAAYEKHLVVPVILPEKTCNPGNLCFNEDANALISRIECDLLYLDPPYNSRQYSDAYHVLENVARWEKPPVHGVARKMDRGKLKSAYCRKDAAQAFEQLIQSARARYVLLSYNNMQEKGNDRSNAKISDEDIMRILQAKGKVTVFEESYKSFSTGKSDIRGNKERLFLCEVSDFESGKNIASPFNYTGGKYKLLPQIQPLFRKTEVFYDMFAGGGNVGVNSDAKRIYLNDKNTQLIRLMKYIQKTPTEELVKAVEHTIEIHGLSNTSRDGYTRYGCNSAGGLAKWNREGFLHLRDQYNQTVKEGHPDPLLLYVLIVFSFNNQIRFNRNGAYNLPVGKRDFNDRMKAKLWSFSEALKRKDIQLENKDFRAISLEEFPAPTFFYADPPYLITEATYNENGGWSETEEKALLKFLDRVNEQGHYFALSNVLESKGKTNSLLSDWVQARGHICTVLEKTYANSNYQRKKRDSITVEVLLTNYTP